jgi:alpha/beta hydrolase family protein
VKRRRALRIFGLVVLVVVLVAAGGLIWFFQPQQTLPEVNVALQSSATVTVTQDGSGITLTPVAGATTGLILYTGAKVPPAGYAVPARQIAERGYLVVIPQLPFNFAVFDVDAASKVIAAHPQIETWAVGGHSLGGAMSAQYVANHPDAVRGLLFWAAYSGIDISSASVRTAVIYGTLDAGADKISSSASLALLPPTPAVTVIEGGNHANFGSYTGQPNDPPASIPREQQQADVVDATVQLLGDIAAP